MATVKKSKETKETKIDLTKQTAAAELAALAKPQIELTPEKKAAKTSVFSGTMSAFDGLMSFPVKTFKATDEDSVSFKQTHVCNHEARTAAKLAGKDIPEPIIVPLKQGKMHCPTCNVDVDSITKAFEYSKDKFIPVTQDEINAQKPAKEEVMNLSDFVDGSTIDPIYFEDAEFVCPDKGGEKPFGALLLTMQTTGKFVKGTRVKGGKVQTFVLRPYGQHGIVLNFLRAEYEIRTFDKWTPITVDDKMQKLVKTLSALAEEATVPFTAAAQDQYLENIRKMINAKLAGKEIEVPTVAAVPAAQDEDALLNALQQSLNERKAKKAVAGKK